MKNLKKVLALVLAMSSVFGLSVTAGAAATDFNDYDEIENKEAVEVMAALNVIGGNNNGDFNPDGYLTRAEMCKMVSYVMNGGQAPVLGTSATPSYTDIKGHWGEAYIEYATNMGIVGGVNGGKFAPDSSLTGTQAAKMMLTAMGYDATVFGFGGTGWDLNVNRYANEAGLYNGLGTLQPNLPITRDQAAQLMYNAMQATMMKRSWTLNPATGEQTETYNPWIITNGDGTTTPVTLLSEKYNGAIKYGYMDGFSYDSAKDKWTYTFETAKAFGGDKIADQDAMKSTTQKSDEDYTDLYGQRVKVIYNTKDQNVTYGIYPSDSSVVVAGATGNIEELSKTSNTVTVSGKDYKLGAKAADIEAFNTNTGINGTLADLMDETKNPTTGYTFKLVDNTGDGKIDAAIKTPVKVAKINYVGKDTVQFSNTVGSKKIDDLKAYDGYAAGDWVYFVDHENSATGVDTIEKAELKTGTIDGVRGGDNANEYSEYRIGDTWLTASKDKDYTSEIVSAEVGDTVEYVTLGSTIFYSAITDAAANSKSIAMVMTAGVETGDNGLSGNTVKAKLLFADGSTKTVKITEVDGKKMTDSSYTELTSMIGDFVTYRVDGSDYELKTIQNDKSGTSVNEANLAGYKALVDDNDGYKNGKVNNVELADDAIVYFFGATADTANSGNEAEVYTGREIKNTWGGETKNLTTAVLTQEVNGFTYAKVAMIQDPNGLPEITSGSNYAYLTETPHRSYEDGKTYLNFTMHTADGELKAKAESTDAPKDYPRGSVITYDVVSDGVIKNVNLPKVYTDAVTGWDGDSKIAFENGGASEIDSKDTTVLYVDSDDMIGVEGGSIQKAYKQNGNYVDNVRYILSANHVVLLVVDVNNEMQENPAPEQNETVKDVAKLQDALKKDNVVVTFESGTSTQPEIKGDLHLYGNTLNVTGTAGLKVDGDLYLEGGKLTGTKVDVTGTTYMGSTLSVDTFTTVDAEIASGAVMNITGGKVTVTNGITGKGDLNIKGAELSAASVAGNVTVSGASKVAISGAVGGNLTVSEGTTGSVSAGSVGGTTTNNSDIGITVGDDTIYKNEKDTKAKSVKVVK